MSCCAVTPQAFFDSDPQFGSRPNYAVMSSVVAGLFLAIPSATQAAIRNAASPSLADVTAAINSVADGDTVMLPAGTAVWNSTLRITKGISLIGQTSTNPVAKEGRRSNDHLSSHRRKREPGVDGG